MTRKKVLVLGGNFGGLTAALAVQHELHGEEDKPALSLASSTALDRGDRRLLYAPP